MTDWLNVSDTTPRVSYMATAAQTLFVVPFVFFENSDLLVYQNTTLLTIDTDYTVAGAADEDGGTVTLLTGATLDDDILIAREIPIEQTTHIAPSGPLDVPAINFQFSRLVAMIQQLAFPLGPAYITDIFVGAATVDTRATAIATTFANTTNVIITGGYLLKGDGGNALYKRVNLSTTGGFQSFDGAYWQLVAEVVNVRTLGAKGDGSTDDTTALQTAITGWNSVYLPKGEFKTTSALSSTAKTLKVYGDGQGLSRIICAHAGNGINCQVDNTSATNMMVEITDIDIVKSGAAGGKAISVTGQQWQPFWAGETQCLISNVRVCSPTLDAGTDKWANGIYLKNISSPRIINFTGHQLNNHTGTAIVIENDDDAVGTFVTFGLTIEKPLINGWQDGIVITGSIEGIDITPYEILVNRSGIYVDGVDHVNNEGNVLQIRGGDVACQGVSCPIEIYNTNNVILNGIDIYRYANAAAKSTVVIATAEQVNVVNCKIGALADQTTTNLLDLFEITNGVVTSNIMLGDSPTGGIAISDSVDVNVTGNLVKTSGGGPQAYYVVNSTRVNVHGNVDKGFTAQAFTSGNTDYTNTDNPHY